MTPECFLVRPERLGAEQQEWLAESRTKATEAGFFIKTLKTRSLPVLPDKGRRMNVLDPKDAARLYRRLHVAPTLVVSVGSALVSTDPTRDPPNRRASRTLEEFVTYKAAFALVRSCEDVEAAFDEVELWAQAVNCEGQGDPRVLPLHVFDKGSLALDLSSPSGMKEFRRRFGSANDREDDSGRRWERGVPHGREALRVAGCELPAGTHWDVSSTGGSFRLLSASEVWKVNAPGYLNVYPDEHVRVPGGKLQGRARKLWPKKNAPL